MRKPTERVRHQSKAKGDCRATIHAAGLYYIDRRSANFLGSQGRLPSQL